MREFYVGFFKPFIIIVLCLFLLLLAVIGVATFEARLAYSSPRMATIALRYEGLHERKHYSRVKQLVGHNPRSTPWCSSFVCAVVKKAGYKCPPGYKAARSFLKWGVRISLKNIRKGDVVIFSRGKGKGHNGFFLRWLKGGMMEIVSGNSQHMVRKGKRSTKRLLGVRRAG